MENIDLLIKKSLMGDQRALGSIIDTYKNYVFAIILNMVKDPHEAENLSQETFISMYRSLAGYRGNSFKVWIGRIAANKAIDWNRKKQREGVGYRTYIHQLDQETFLMEPSVEDQVLKAEDFKKLRGLLVQLPEKYSHVLEQYFIEAKNYREIAEREGISVRTVESRLYRGKKLLQRAWKEDG